MTGTPDPGPLPAATGATGSPGPGPIQGYYVVWSGAEKGSADDDEIPGIGTPGSGNDDGEEDNFPTEFKWPNVEINYGDGITKYEQKIEGIVKGYSEQMTPQGEKTFTSVETAYKLTIESCNTGASASGSCGGGEWEDSLYDDRYGGVFVYTENTPVNKSKGEKSTCGTTKDKVNDVDSGYIYVLVFDQSDFEYYTLNSSKSKDKFKDPFDDSAFKTTPSYPNVKDKFKKAAPIYPMDTITKFLPDGREKVYVKYTVKLEAEVDGKNVSLENGEITITHAVTQNTGSYPEKLDQLLKFCNYDNPGGFDEDEFSEKYPLDYPYTIISNSAPTKRVTFGIEDGDLRKGDLWYNPSKDERRYYSVNDIPDDLEVEEGGRNYEDADNVTTSLIPPESERCNPRDAEKMPYGLNVDIKTKNGRIVSASISDEDYANISNYSDGDLLAVQGGNGQGVVKVVIDSDGDKWIENYVEEEI